MAADAEERNHGGGGGGGARPAAADEFRRPAASDESRAAYRGGARAAKERAAPARRDRRAPAVEFVRTAGHLRGRGALDAGAAAPYRHPGAQKALSCEARAPRAVRECDDE